MLVWALGFVKLSILFFYRRVFYTGKAGVFDLATKVSIATVTLWTIGFFLALLLTCGTNIPANWGDVAALQLTCGEPLFTIEDGLGISDFILDLLILVLPILKVGSNAPLSIDSQLTCSTQDLVTSSQACQKIGSHWYFYAWIRVSYFLAVGP